MEEASDMSMPRAKKDIGRRPVYWWNREIELLRSVCISKRRAWVRTKRNAPIEIAARRGASYKRARGDLRKAIWKAKCAAWNNLLNKLEEDPWGKPYKVVIKKHPVAGPMVCESLSASILNRIVDTLFPRHEIVPSEEIYVDWTPDLEVTALEVTALETEAAIKKISRKKAPDPSGIMGMILRVSGAVLKEKWRLCFTSCLKHEYFPDSWKRTRLILLKKEGKQDLIPSSYRPICLLDEPGKLFERIIAKRIIDVLDENEGLSERNLVSAPDAQQPTL